MLHRKSIVTRPLFLCENAHIAVHDFLWSQGRAWYDIWSCQVRFLPLLIMKICFLDWEQSKTGSRLPLTAIFSLGMNILQLSTINERLSVNIYELIKISEGTSVSALYVNRKKKNFPFKYQLVVDGLLSPRCFARGQTYGNDTQASELSGTPP